MVDVRGSDTPRNPPSSDCERLPATGEKLEPVTLMAGSGGLIKGQALECAPGLRQRNQGQFYTEWRTEPDEEEPSF